MKPTNNNFLPYPVRSLVFIFLSLLLPSLAFGQMGPSAPIERSPALDGSLRPEMNVTTDVIEKLGEMVPADAVFKDDTGRTVSIGDYLNRGRPVILQLGYFECPMLCGLVSKGMVKSLRDIRLDAGAEYDILYVSINPGEVWELAQAKKRNMLRELGRPGDAIGWHLLTGEKEQIDRITSAVGFEYQFIEDIGEYAHAAVLIVLSPEGKITRYLYGVEFDPKVLRLSLIEASDGKVGSTIDRILLTCFRFNHATGKYQAFAVGMLRLGAAITVIVMGAIFLPIWIRAFLRSRANKSSTTKPVPST